MITGIKSEKMVIISDMHIGNPFSEARRKLIEFIRWASDNHYDICINGDGIEIAQASFKKISQEIPDIFRAIKGSTRTGHKIFYVVGNHDIALEHFLEDWGALKVAPFLNVESGESRIRVEHGHLYDPFFVRAPRTYEFLTWLGGFFLKAHPQIYKVWIAFERFRSYLRYRKTGILGELPHFAVAAEELAKRGFDYIIFGHTHHVGESPLENGKKYFNTGSWLLGTPYVEILNGEVSLKQWQKNRNK